MAERASMPTFVPRTVASFERAATAVARRVAAPVRMLAARALSFADRLVGTWAGTGPTVAGYDGGARPAMRAATRGGAMPLPRPWYEVDADEDAIWPQQAGRSATAHPASAPGASAATASVAAERGAAIARTALTAPPEIVARAADAAADAGESSRGSATVGIAAADLRVAEALGLHAPSAPVAPVVAAPAARATTPLARALAHAAWVDAQLRVAAAPLEPAPRAVGGLVFVAPADVERPSAALAQGAGEPAARESSRAEQAIREQAIRGQAALAQPGRTMAQPAMPAAAAWSAVLPDPRLPATMPTTIARRVAEFVAGLVGVQSARDVAAPPMGGETAAMAAATRASDAATMPRAVTERTYVLLAPPSSAPVSWRPGAAGARVEQLSARIDARAMMAWGEPATTAATVAAAGVASPSAAGDAPVARQVPLLARTYVAPAETPARARGAARLSQFVQQLVGVQAARATAPLPVQALVAAVEHGGRPAVGGAAPVSERAPQRVTLAATTSAVPGMVAAEGAPSMPRVAAATAPGAIARRAEQLGGAVGVRAASLSIDFVDPARLSLFAAAPSMPTVAPAEAAPSRASDTIMPAARPLFATASGAAGAAPSLSAEEWSLVATFPSAATAVQLAAARQSQNWTAPERTMLSAIAAGEGAMAARAIGRVVGPAGERTTAQPAARGGAPAEYVVPIVAPAQAEGRLPGGRTPRGSFTWPKLADASLARAEWVAPAVVAVAEQAKQVAPGMPRWGALPPLVTVSPSLAASTSAVEATAGASSSATAGTREAVRGHAAATMATTTTTGGDAREAASGATSTRAPRGDAPAMTLMTAAATREARAAARMGVRDDGSGDGGEGGGARPAPSMPTTAAGGERAPTVAVSNVRPLAAMPLMTAGPTAPRDGAGGTAGAAARALDLARPFMKLIEGGIAGDGASRSSSAPRFYEQPQPVVAGAPSSDSASRIVEALRSQPATPSSDDRVSLADLTLIAIASATQQVAASPAGGGPSGGGASAAAPAAAPAADAGHGGGKSGNPAQEIEELARAAFDELQRLFAMARERSGEHG